MYFEDIFKKVEKIWNRNFSLSANENNKASSVQLQEFYHQIENDFVGKDDWCDLLNWSIYVVVGEYADRFCGKREYLSFNEISINEIEERFKKDLEDPSWAEEKKMYKGLRQKIIN